MIKNMTLLTVLLVLSAGISAQAKKEGQQVYKLSYLEREPGTDEYEVTMLVSARYIRIDEEGEGESSGFIVYDDKDKVIYSVSHFDQSVLVIKEHVFSTDDLPLKPTIEYLPLVDAPKVSGKAVFNYRVYVNENKNEGQNESEETCIEVQLVENLLPEVRAILQNYQKVISGQQVKMVDNKITDIQTACYYIDQIYNTGAYFEKGLPIQEWHNNESSKILTGYKKVSVAADKFKIPQEYRQFSIDDKTFIK